MGLDTVEFVLWAEERFALKIPDDDAAGWVTVGAFCGYVACRLAERQGLRAPSRGAIFEQVASHLVQQYRVPRQRITEAARFVQDLGLE
jgi:acyl carrier protein